MTTILCVRREAKVVIAGDGQVSLNKTVMKNTVKFDHFEFLTRTYQKPRASS